MRDNLTLVVVIVDSSGSMSVIRDQTISGINKIIEENKADKEDCLFSLYTFDSFSREVYSFRDIKEVEYITPSTYSPMGGTALHDTVVHVIDTVGAKLASIPEDLRPGKILVSIITDGEENASTKYRAKDVKDRIEHQTTKYNWNFMYLGANHDSITTSANLGIGRGFTANYSTKNVESAFLSMSNNSRSLKRMGFMDEYTEQERANLVK